MNWWVISGLTLYIVASFIGGFWLRLALKINEMPKWASRTITVSDIGNAIWYGIASVFFSWFVVPFVLTMFIFDEFINPSVRKLGKIELFTIPNESTKE